MEPWQDAMASRAELFLDQGASTHGKILRELCRNSSNRSSMDHIKDGFGIGSKGRSKVFFGYLIMEHRASKSQFLTPISVSFSIVQFAAS
jgi:hypothetical protein